MIKSGESVEQFLLTGRQEYSQFEDGRLHLTLRLPGENRGATVSRVGQLDLFTLDHADDNAQLQAMALAAQELRQPLACIMTVSDRLFPITGSESDPALQEQIARINRGLFQMLRIVGNMSDAYRYSRDSATSMQLRDIPALIAELLQGSAPLVSHAGVELQYTGLNEPVYGLVDAEKLERGISNILSNAIKFSPKGSLIDARLTRHGNMLHLTVCDSGDGVDEKLQASVYSRFSRDPAIEDSRHGIGLGMVLVRAAAAVHGGTVLIDGARGTRITMTIAIRQEQENVVRSNRLLVDYAGEWDHRLIELSDVLPPEAYRKENIN
jgi:signal transduction histidine kinase